MKMLVWNIQNFTINKINVGTGETLAYYDADGSPVAAYPLSDYRNWYIMNNIATYDPDIFVVIEVISSRGVKGSLLPCESAGGQGVTALYERMLVEFPDKNWRLVPPLKLTDKIVVEEIESAEGETEVSLVTEGQYTEAIAVFYREDVLEFIGPYVWPQTPEGTNDNPAKTAAVYDPVVGTEAYPAPWTNVLPAGNHRAGQFMYYDPETGRELFFPGPGSRRPFTTRFIETGTGRIITLVSVHYPPNTLDAAAANAAIMRYYSRQNYNAHPDETIIIAGDFNINTLGRYGLTLDDSVQWGFSVLFEGPRAMPTMYKRIPNAMPDDYISQLCLDNIAWRCGTNERVPGIFGRPCDRVRNPPGNTLMIPDVDVIEGLPEPWSTEVFRRPQNFGKIGPVPGTSDHMAIYYEF